MRSLLDAERAVALLSLVDVLLSELPGWEIRVDGVRGVDEAGCRELVRRGVERACCAGRIGEA